MNTNDPKAPYTVKLNGPVEAATAPMLSYEEMRAFLDEEAEDCGIDDETTQGNAEWQAMNAGANVTREWYEAKIASGELMVVPKDTAGRCLKCNTRVAEQHNSRKWHFPKFCPNCGKESPEAKG